MGVKLTRPIMRWHGGNWKLAPWIIAYFPKHKIYEQLDMFVQQPSIEEFKQAGFEL